MAAFTAAECIRKTSKSPATFQCSLCSRSFTRAFNLQGHLRTHADERPFTCTLCGVGFARKHDRKSHELTHSKEKKFVCGGDLANGQKWGCGHRFTLRKNLMRHFRSNKGTTCFKPYLDEEISKLEVAASVLTGLASSASFPEQQHRQPPLPTSTWMGPEIPMEFTPEVLVPNEGVHVPLLDRAPSPLPVAGEELPTWAQAIKAADTVHRYIQYHGRLDTEENGFPGYLELTFKSAAYQTSSLNPAFL